jgi:hypothetical protein
VVKQAAEAKQITARISIVALQLLWRHILQGPYDLSVARERRRQGSVSFLERTTLLGQAEIQQLNALLRDENVRGLQIAVLSLEAYREHFMQESFGGNSACW